MDPKELLEQIEEAPNYLEAKRQAALDVWIRDKFLETTGILIHFKNNTAEVGNFTIRFWDDWDEDSGSWYKWVFKHKTRKEINISGLWIWKKIREIPYKRICDDNLSEISALIKEFSMLER